MSDRESGLRSILSSWGKFPATAPADFECLVREVMVTLDSQVADDDLYAVIQTEFFNHTGVQGNPSDVKDVVEDILDWWKSV